VTQQEEEEVPGDPGQQELKENYKFLGLKFFSFVKQISEKNLMFKCLACPPGSEKCIMASTASVFNLQTAHHARSRHLHLLKELNCACETQNQRRPRSSQPSHATNN